jgi:glycerol-3-phosphate cytidylyltransferase
MKVITFGTFDLFHIGHLSILKRASELGDSLVVGVSTDTLNMSKKNKKTIYSFEDRRQILESIKYVTEVFPEESLEEKREYVIGHSADILVMGDDWEGKFDYLSDIVRVVYLPRTPSISTTETVEKIISINNK